MFCYHLYSWARRVPFTCFWWQVAIFHCKLLLSTVNLEKSVKPGAAMSWTLPVRCSIFTDPLQVTLHHRCWFLILNIYYIKPATKVQIQLGSFASLPFLLSDQHYSQVCVLYIRNSFDHKIQRTQTLNYAVLSTTPWGDVLVICIFPVILNQFLKA